MWPDHDRRINRLPGGWGFGEGQEESKQVEQEKDHRAGIVSGSGPTDQPLAAGRGFGEGQYALLAEDRPGSDKAVQKHESPLARARAVLALSGPHRQLVLATTRLRRRVGWRVLRAYLDAM